MSERRTTPPPKVDITTVFPEFSGLKRNAVRLFPRPAPQMDVIDSKLGGRIIWPQGESWPTCALHQVPFVPLIQLTKTEVPELGFKPGFEVFQIVWCPHTHSDYNFLPEHRTYWRKLPEGGEPLSITPEVQLNEKFLPQDAGDFVPTQCRFYPEGILEYPSYEELPRGLQDKLGQWNILDIPGIDKLRIDWERMPFSPGGWFYCVELSVAGGTKIGGYPEWIQFPEYPVCTCGRTMEHLLSISSLETVWGNPAGRWIPIEEKHLSENERYALHYGTGLMFGDGGILYIFICRSCADWPIKFVWQCG